MLLGLLVAAAIIIFDQLSKYYIMYHILGGYGIIPYTSYFNLVKAWNTGVSFSMFNDHGTIGRYALCLVAIAIVSFLVNWLRTEKEKYLQLSLGFIIGGALGNVIDRIRFGAVFDFLDFYWGSYHWPAFNVADSFICIGATMIIAHGVYTTIKKGLKK